MVFITGVNYDVYNRPCLSQPDGCYDGVTQKTVTDTPSFLGSGLQGLVKLQAFVVCWVLIFKCRSFPPLDSYK